MFFKEGTDRNGSTLVKENQHQRPADEGVSSRLRAANSITALTWLRSKPSNQFIMSSILAPASKFSKITETGMRVPFSTQAPLTFPGTLSTAAHCDQSRGIAPACKSCNQTRSSAGIGEPLYLVLD